MRGVFMSNFVTQYEFIKEMLSLMPRTEATAMSARQITEKLLANNLYDYTPQRKCADQRNAVRTPTRHLNNLVDAGLIIRVNHSSGHKYYKSETPETPLFQLFSEYSLAPSSCVDSTQNGLARKRAYLTNEQVKERMLHKSALVVMLPNKAINDANNVILQAIKSQRKVTFDYFKSREKSAQLRIVEPIGIINDNANFLLIAANEKGKIRKFCIAKMSNVTVEYHKPLFHLSVFSHKRQIQILHSGIEEHWLTKRRDKIILVLKKEAANVFASTQMAFCKNWQFKWIDKNASVAQISFDRKISVNLVRHIKSYGKYIEIQKSNKLKAMVEQHSKEPLKISKVNLTHAA